MRANLDLRLPFRASEHVPAQAIKLIERQIYAFEIKHMMCDFWRAGKAREDRQRSMKLFGERVIPYFSSASEKRIAAV